MKFLNYNNRFYFISLITNISKNKTNISTTNNNYL